jgi:ferredoxin-type protein NapH
MNTLVAHRWLLARRTTQLGILALFWLGAHAHLGVLTGNLSASRLLRSVPLADPFASLQIVATGHLPATTALVGAASVLGFYFLVGGRAFCGWVCPVNLVSDTAGWMRRRWHLGGQFRVERSTRYWILGLALVVSAVTGVAAFEAVSPIGMLHRELIFGAGLGLLAAVALLVLDLFVLRYGWCGSLCPLGAFYSLVGRWSLLRVGFDRERCDRCGDCAKVCPEPQVLHFGDIEAAGFVDSGNCLNCARCLEVCPRDAFRFSTRLNPHPPLEAGASG